MNDKDWVILSVLQEERNITRTAERLYMTQPALTHRIQQMENFFQTQLIVRNRIGVQFTPQGDIVSQYATEMLKQLQDTVDTIAAMEKEVKGTIKLGVSSVVGRYMLPHMLQQFLSRYPHLDVNVVTGLSKYIEHILHEGNIHIAILRGDLQWPEKRLLFNTEPVVVLSKTPLKIDELPHYNRIYYKTDSSFKNLLDKWWRAHFTQPARINMSVDNLETCREMAIKGLGYTILPEIYLENVENKADLFIEPLFAQNDQPLTRKTWLLCRNKSLEFPMVRHFFDFFSK